MNTKKAKEIVEMLADGVDPTTGEILPPDSHFNDPEIIRALFTVLRSVRLPVKASKKPIKEKQKENIENGKPKNAGLPWTQKQKNKVALLFDQGKTTKELSKYLERTKGAIISELTHQGLI